MMTAHVGRHSRVATLQITDPCQTLLDMKHMIFGSRIKQEENIILIKWFAPQIILSNILHWLLHMTTDLWGLTGLKNLEEKDILPKTKLVTVCVWNLISSMQCDDSNHDDQDCDDDVRRSSVGDCTKTRDGESRIQGSYRCNSWFILFVTSVMAVFTIIIIIIIIILIIILIIIMIIINFTILVYMKGARASRSRESI